MITYSNIQRIENLPFEDYLKLPCYSHSFARQERNGVAGDFTVSDQMKLGSLVDKILTDQSSVKMNDILYPAARDIAKMIASKFGGLIDKFYKQVSYTGEMSLNGFIMPVKGRPDLELKDIAIIDLKITKMKDLPGLIKFMGYENAQWHYAKLAEVKNSYLMIYSMPLKRTELIKLNVSSDTNYFWADKLIRFGKVND